MTYRILVTGSRDWKDRDKIREALLDIWSEQGCPNDIVLVHGDCPTGADRMADEIWDGFLGYPVERHPAKWAILGKRAGPVRNQEMVDLGADIVLAFPLGESKGTRGCMKMAKKAGIPVINLGDSD